MTQALRRLSWGLRSAQAKLRSALPRFSRRFRGFSHGWLTRAGGAGGAGCTRCGGGPPGPPDGGPAGRARPRRNNWRTALPTFAGSMPFASLTASTTRPSSGSAPVSTVRSARNLSKTSWVASAPVCCRQERHQLIALTGLAPASLGGLLEPRILAHLRRATRTRTTVAHRRAARTTRDAGHDRQTAGADHQDHPADRQTADADHQDHPAGRRTAGAGHQGRPADRRKAGREPGTPGIGGGIPSRPAPRSPPRSGRRKRSPPPGPPRPRSPPPRSPPRPPRPPGPPPPPLPPRGRIGTSPPRRSSSYMPPRFMRWRRPPPSP